MKTIPNCFKVRSAAPNQAAAIATIRSVLQLKESKAWLVCLFGKRKLWRAQPVQAVVGSGQGCVAGRVSLSGGLH